MRPQMAVHNARTDELQEDVKRVLEFVIEPRLREAGMHRTCKWRMCMRIEQESGVSDALGSVGGTEKGWR